MNKVIDFKSALCERTQRSIQHKVHRTVEGGFLTSVNDLKLHFKEWLVIEQEKTERKKEFTEQLEQNKINHG